jgi:C1A family cysteine protease
MTQRILNALPSPPDPRDYQHVAETVALVGLAGRFTLTGLGPVLDQGSTPECTAYSAVGIRQWHEKRDGNGLVPFSPSVLYERVKALELRETGIDFDGAYLRDVLRVMKGSGTPLPSGANGGKIADYQRVALGVAPMKAALAEGPLYVGLNWDAAWFRCPRSLKLPPPVGQNVGGHAVYIWGWDDSAGWIIRNSWGKAWGNGNGYMRYEWLEAAAFEAWLARDVKGD